MMIFSESGFDMILKGYIFSVLYAFLCLAVGFAVYKIPGAEKKITRKIVHILVGFEWVILYRFFGASSHFLAVCLFFLLILAISHCKNLMPMISSDGDNAPGTVYYALAMSIMALICLFEPKMMLPFGIGVFCTSLGDGFAGLMGYLNDPDRNIFNLKLYGQKTLFGVLFNLIFSYLVAFCFSAEFSLGLTVWHCLAIAALSVELELFTGKGLDNITITLGTSFLAYFFINCQSVWNYIIPILLTPLIIAFAYKKKALTVSGIIAAVFVDILISVSLGNLGFVILLAFFVGGVVVDKIKKRNKKSRQKRKNNIEKRGDCRNYTQVLANSLVAAALAVLYFFTKEKLFVIAFCASLAEAFADTSASGIGILSGRAFDPFRMKKCTPGISGGVSVLGLIASLVAAAIISAISLCFSFITLIDAAIITLSAFLGALFDSLLGSLLQVKYKCTVCDSIVEREEHCGKPTQKHSGIRIINNDIVNFLGTFFSGAVAVGLSVLL